MSRTERYQRRQQLECGFRVVQGDQPGLSGRWRHGVATLSPNAISFRRSIGGLRFLRAGPNRFAVTNIDLDFRRTARLKEALGVAPGFEVIRCTTSTAVLEWVMAPGLIPWAVDQLRGN